MKIIQINSLCGSGSTGRICVEISKLLTANGIENYILYTEGNSDYPYAIKYSGFLYKKIQAIKSRLFGNYGFNSHLATKKLIREIDRIKPDIIQLHNIHGHDFNLSVFFDYIAAHNIKVVWSLHDCWAFTGYCTHFTMSNCDRWQNGCGNCVQRKNYSWFFDKSRKNFNKKKKMLRDIDVTFVVASRWLAKLIENSHAKGHRVEVITNGIDKSVFAPTESSFRDKYNLSDKHIVLGVTFAWGIKKGLDVFCELARRLNDDYKIVMVGTNDNIDKQLPEGVISIHRTNNQKELAQIYSAADVFVNPTREETFGMTNIEALACGTPVITFDAGGSPETIDETCGSSVPVNDIDELESQIRICCEEKKYSSKACTDRSALFTSEAAFQKYIDLYIDLSRRIKGE